MRFPLRLRLTLVFSVGMAIVLVGLGTWVYLQFESGLLTAVDIGLRPRAQVLKDALAHQRVAELEPQGNLIDADEAFAQVLGPAGEIVAASQGVRNEPLVDAGMLLSLTGPTFISRLVPGLEDPARLLIVPLDAPDDRIVVVGSTLSDTNDALNDLLVVMATVGPLALAITSAAGWLLAGAALRPVEQMRQEAAAITASEPSRRLVVPMTGDELARLGATLNSMLDRLQEALERERRFVNDASHELRTPLATLRAEIDLALARPRSGPELEASLRSAKEDVDRLHRLAEDLLVLARSREGRIPVRRVATSVPDLVASSVRSVSALADAAAVRIEADAADETVEIDADRVRQALRNLLENAIRHTPADGVVEISAGRTGGVLRFVVTDPGPGFPPSVLAQVFDPFVRDGGAESRDGHTGLGLTIVRAVAGAHAGRAIAENLPSGARVTLELRV